LPVFLLRLLQKLTKYKSKANGAQRLSANSSRLLLLFCWLVGAQLPLPCGRWHGRRAGACGPGARSQPGPGPRTPDPRRPPTSRAGFPKYGCTQGGAATKRECGTSLKNSKSAIKLLQVVLASAPTAKTRVLASKPAQRRHPPQ
jgi:hypothetical protein